MTVTHLIGHCVEMLATLSPASVDCVVTSPPYWGLRRYGTPDVTWADGWVGELGQEPTPRQYLAHLAEVFDAVRRVLKPTGTLWVNLGDSYATAQGPQSPTGMDGKVRSGAQHSGRASITRQPDARPKSLLGIPWRFALGMIDDGWILRQDIIWAKPNPMPESVRDRCTKAHEYVFLFAQSERYHWHADAMQEPAIHAGAVMKPSGASSKNAAYATVGGGGVRSGFVSRGTVTGATRNRRSWWPVVVAHSPEQHYATYPPELIRPMIRASCPPGGVVLDPFGGSGTTAVVAMQEGRDCINVELVPAYVDIARRRLA